MDAPAVDVRVIARRVVVAVGARVKRSWKQDGAGKRKREKLLSSIAAIAGDLNLYDVSTPESVYTSCNITRYD